MKNLAVHGSRITVHDALLEIGSEELPAAFIVLGMTQLQACAESSLKENGLSFSAIHAYGTPRRLALVITGLPDRSPDQERVMAGPPAAKGKDPSGQWTQAAIGFAAKNGLRPDDLVVQQDRLCAILKVKGVPTRQLLGQLFPTWVRHPQFPKTMVWEPTQLRYPRPIRWIAALFGSDTVSFKLAGVSSGRWSLGLGPWSPKKILITHAGKYALLLKNQCVLVDPDIRKETIRRIADQAVKRLPAGKAGVHGKLHMSTSLLDQVANLVEHPVAILGNFDPAYLDLPKEVLITCLEHHQKYFPVEAPHPNPPPKGEGDPRQEEGKLLPHFVGIRNGMSMNQDIVREGYERVLSARLADARFFYNHDRKSPLASKVEALKGVMFQQKLGNLYEKKERIKRLLREIFPLLPSREKADEVRMRVPSPQPSPDPPRHLGGPADAAVAGKGEGEVSWLAQAERAADLCKADLVTDMVREFPELQGIVARLYAQSDGEDAVVSRALEQHYWPATLSGPLPETDVAAFLALADKLDTLAGDFAIGLIPTGSADPYGLRRAAVGVLRILEDKAWSVNVELLIEKSVSVQPVGQIAQETKSKLVQFFRQRLSAVLEERGFKSDEIDAVLALGLGIIPETLARVDALHQLRKKAEFGPLSVAFKRAMNIVKQAAKGVPALAGEGAAIQADLLREPCEQVLYKILESTGVEVTKNIQARAYRQALESMVPLREPLDGFFNGVMVMAEDPALRANRLALMKRLVSLFAQIADFSVLQNG